VKKKDEKDEKTEVEGKEHQGYPRLDCVPNKETRTPENIGWVGKPMLPHTHPYPSTDTGTDNRRCSLVGKLKYIVIHQRWQSTSFGSMLRLVRISASPPDPKKGRESGHNAPVQFS